MSSEFKYLTHKCSCGIDHEIKIELELPWTSSKTGFSSGETVFEAEGMTLKVCVKEME